ncbi:hypothetical protein EHM69_05130 [candidate division KSB1 bacterium]|nr:MAG: hypothetical protein EHM69_05130 [candidate division KSB1 bacterium]
MKRVISVMIFLIVCAIVNGQTVGEKYLLDRLGSQIPGHPAAGNNSVSVKFPHGSVAEILAYDNATGWYEVKADGSTAWIIKKYIGAKVGTEIPPNEVPPCIIGCWNLEWLKDGKPRGFPENTKGGPSYEERTEKDYAAIAEVISDQLQTAALVLVEIAAFADSGTVRSTELDRLCSHLGENFLYIAGESGKDQHVAILYDKRKLRLNSSVEIVVPEKKVQQTDIFYRDPLAAHFTCLSGGNGGVLNDFILVGLHLASGQDKNKNHDAAMKLLADTLTYLIHAGEYLPAGENDIILAGDLNLDFFDNKKELQLVAMENGSWDILADNGYPATRLAGVPVTPKSKIDYVIVTDAMCGSAKHVEASQAAVRQDLAGGEWDEWRKVFSDHFPVVISVKPLPDDD